MGDVITGVDLGHFGWGCWALVPTRKREVFPWSV